MRAWRLCSLRRRRGEHSISERRRNLHLRSGLSQGNFGTATLIWNLRTWMMQTSRASRHRPSPDPSTCTDSPTYYMEYAAPIFSPSDGIAISEARTSTVEEAMERTSPAASHHTGGNSWGFRPPIAEKERDKRTSCSQHRRPGPPTRDERRP